MGNTLIMLILGVLSTYRVSRMIVGEKGPFNLFEKLRDWIMIKYDPKHWIYNGIGCPLCVSYWIAAIFALYTAETPIIWLLNWQAIAGAVALIYTRFEGN